MRPTGLLSVTFRHLPFERIIELTAEAGLDGIEWGSDVHVPPGDLKQAEKIGEATRSAGLINFSYGSYWYADTEPEMIAETSAALGARWIRVWAGKLPSAGCPPEIRRRTVGYLQKICRVSAGLQIAAEWHPTLNGELTPEMVMAGSSRYIWWQCPQGHVWRARVDTRAGVQHSGCPVCAGNCRTRAHTLTQHR